MVYTGASANSAVVRTVPFILLLRGKVLQKRLLSPLQDRSLGCSLWCAQLNPQLSVCWNSPEDIWCMEWLLETGPELKEGGWVGGQEKWGRDQVFWFPPSLVKEEGGSEGRRESPWTLSPLIYFVQCLNLPPPPRFNYRMLWRSERGVGRWKSKWGNRRSVADYFCPFGRRDLREVDWIGGCLRKYRAPALWRGAEKKPTQAAGSMVSCLQKKKKPVIRAQPLPPPPPRSRVALMCPRLGLWSCGGKLFMC